MLTPPTTSSAWQGPTSTPLDALTLAPKRLMTGPSSSSTAAAAAAAAVVLGPGLSPRLGTASPASCPAHNPTSVSVLSASTPASRLNAHKPRRGIKRGRSPSSLTGSAGSVDPADPANSEDGAASSPPSTPSYLDIAGSRLRRKQSAQATPHSSCDEHPPPLVPAPSQPRLSLSSLLVPTALPIASPPPSPVLRTHRAAVQGPPQTQSPPQSQAQVHAAKRLRRLSFSSYTSASDSEDEEDSQPHSNPAKPDRGRMNFPLPPGIRIGPSPLHQEFSFSIQSGTGSGNARSFSPPKEFGLPAGRGRALRGLWSAPAPLTPIIASTASSDEPALNRAPTPAEKDEVKDRLSPLTPVTSVTSVTPLAPSRNTTPNTNSLAPMPTSPLVLSKARARIMGLVNPDQPEKAGMEIEKVFALGYGRALGRSKANGAVNASGLGLGLRGVARWVREDRVASTAAGEEQRQHAEEQDCMEDIEEREREEEEKQEEDEEAGSKEGMDIDVEV